MLVQVWCPDISTGVEILNYLQEFGFVDVPELAEWYHRNGSIIDIGPAPVKKQEDVWTKRLETGDVQEEDPES